MIKNQKYNLFALGFFILLTIVIGWPILRQLDSVIIGSDSDVFINTWADWWTKKALLSPDINLWQTEYLFYPLGANLIYHSFSHFNTFFSLLLQFFIDPLSAYNITILSNYVLTGFAMFQFLYYLLKSPSAGIIGGIVFAYSSHNLYQSSHPVLVSIWCFPWVTLYLFRAVREDQLKWAFVAGIFVFLGAASSSLLLFLIFLWVGILFIYMWFAKEWKRPSWSIILVFGLTSAILVFPLIFPLLREAFSAGNTSFVIDSEKSISFDAIYSIIPHWLSWHKYSIYFGIIPLWLAVISVVKRRQDARLWIILFIFALLMALGPQPRLLGKELNIILPWSTVVTPFIRNTYRFIILLSFSFSVLVAIGWDEIYRKMQLKSTIRYAVLAGVVFLIIIDYFVPLMPYTPIHISPFYTDFLRNEPVDAAVAILPNGRYEGKHHLLYQTFHEHPITGGVVSRAKEDTFNFISTNSILDASVITERSLHSPQQVNQSLMELADVNIKYLIIDKTLMANADAWLKVIPYPPFYEDDLILVFKTDANP